MAIRGSRPSEFQFWVHGPSTQRAASAVRSPAAASCPNERGRIVAMKSEQLRRLTQGSPVVGQRKAETTGPRMLFAYAASPRAFSALANAVAALSSSKRAQCERLRLSAVVKLS